MTHNSYKWVLFTIVSFLLVLGAALFSLTMGEANISVKEIIPILREKEGMNYFILANVRFPRIVLAFAVGGGLSLSGAILQGVFRNPLVEPYTLGISGGAAFGVALTIISGLHISMGSYMLPLSGFIGALITILLVSFIGFIKGGGDINKMLLIGVMISFVSSSSMMFLMSVSTAENIHGIIFWIMGSLDEPNQFLIKTAFYTSIAGLLISYIFARPLNALRLGEAKARHLGINSIMSIRILFVLASLLTGICVSVAGVIGFVGLVIPHMVRMIAGSDYRILLIGSYLGGSLFLILSDIVARTIIAPNELPIGVITGITGGVIFILVLNNFRKNRAHYES